MPQPHPRTSIRPAREWRQSLLHFNLDNPLLLGAIVVLLAASAVALVTRSMFSRLAPLSMEDVGTPARADYKAARDFTYTEVDVVATEKKREEAARAVLPVYDFDLEERDRVTEQMRQGFRYVREVFESHQAQLDELMGVQGRNGGEARDEPRAPEGGNGQRTPGGGRPPRGQVGEAARGGAEKAVSPDVAGRMRELDIWLAAQLDERKDEFFRLMHQTLTQEEYELLVAQRFSREVEDNLSYLVSGIMQNKVLTGMRPLNRHREEGIRLRITRGATSVDEIDVREDFSEFITVQDAVERLVVMARRGLKGVDPELRDRLVDIAGRLVVPNCQYNRVETESRREKARAGVDNLSTTRPFRKGQIIVDRGHIVTAQHVRIFRASLQELEDEDLLLAVLGNTLVVLCLTFIFVSFFRRFVRKFAVERKDLIFLGFWCVSMLLFFRISLAIIEALAESWRSIPAEAYIYLIPVAAVPMLVRMVLNAETAVVVAVLEASFISIMINWNMPYLLFALAGGLTAAGGVGKAKQRTDMLHAALRTCVMNLLFAIGLSAISGTLLSTDGLAVIVLAAIGGILTGLLVTALLPIVEAVFGYTTNIKLLELANLNNPLLKDLAIRAPGTFHHSILVGNLVEIAAESIRSNPLLARVGAYYHDVGKIKAPHYFAENQRPGQNPHDKLKPSMSALILKEHVRDGVKLLRSRGYPKILADICEQHVGTTLISYFYQRAKEQAEEKGEPPPLETDYRYLGPKPQTREAALVFLGDSVEAAAKSMTDPSPARLQAMVQKLISARFIDGQLAECNLTLGDLHAIARAFTRGLTGIYHFRPEYPGDRKRKEDTGSSRRTSQTQRQSAVASPSQAEQEIITTGPQVLMQDEPAARVPDDLPAAVGPAAAERAAAVASELPGTLDGYGEARRGVFGTEECNGEARRQPTPRSHDGIEDEGGQAGDDVLRSSSSSTTGGGDGPAGGGAGDGILRGAATHDEAPGLRHLGSVEPG